MKMYKWNGNHLFRFQYGSGETRISYTLYHIHVYYTISIISTICYTSRYREPRGLYRLSYFRFRRLIYAPLQFITSSAFYWHGLTLNPAWISNYIHNKVCDLNSYSFLNFNGATVEV